MTITSEKEIEEFSEKVKYAKLTVENNNLREENKRLREHINKHSFLLQSCNLCFYYNRELGYNFEPFKTLKYGQTKLICSGIELTNTSVAVLDYYHYSDKGIENCGKELIKFDNFLKSRFLSVNNGKFIAVFFIDDTLNKEKTQTEIKYALNKYYTSAPFQVEVYHKSEEVYTFLVDKK